MRCGGGYKLTGPPKAWQKPDFDTVQTVTAGDQSKRLDAIRKKLTKNEEALHRACIAGDEIGAKLAVRNGARIDCVDEAR